MEGNELESLKEDLLNERSDAQEAAEATILKRNALAGESARRREEEAVHAIRLKMESEAREAEGA